MTPQQLKKELLKFNTATLADIIVAAISRKRDFKNAILEQVNERLEMQDFYGGDISEQKVKINDTLLSGYWKDLKKIVNYFNNYGGGDTKDENKAYDLFDKLNTLAKKEIFSDKLRMDIFREVLFEHNRGNSGFDHVLDELLHGLCLHKEDWKILFDYYDNHKYDFYSQKATKIRQEKL